MAGNYTLSTEQRLTDLLISYTPLLQGRQAPNMPLHEQISQAMRRDDLKIDPLFVQALAYYFSGRKK